MEGVMPKERFKDNGASQFDLVVGWDVYGEYAQIAVVDSEDRDVVQIGDEVFTGLYHTLSEESIDELIKVLRKVKRKTFGTAKA
jgi:hypothetical protein